MRSNGLAGRPRMAVKDRMKLGRESMLICVATNLSAEDVERLDRAAAASGITRAGFIRALILRELAP